MAPTVNGWRRVRLHAAGATASGVLLDAATWVVWQKRLTGALSVLAGGGCTVYEARGCWRGQPEPTVIIEAYVTDAVWRSPARLAFDREVQRFLCATYQESVLLTAEWLPAGEVEFIRALDSEGIVSIA